MAQNPPFSPQNKKLPQNERRERNDGKERTKPAARGKKNTKPPQTAPKPNPEAPFGVGGGAQRKKSLSQSWGAGSWCSTCPARNASLCAYLQGAGTRMVPGQFQ